jgi:phosphatidylglycerophosphate synthase
MQALIAIPELSVLRKYTDAEGALTREIAGVPLLVRVIATARRAGVDSLLVIWPPDVGQSIWDRCAAHPLLRDLQITSIVRPFDPRRHDDWLAIAASLADQFLWLPWNWVTNKRVLTELAPLAVQPASWDAPALLERRAAISHTRIQLAAGTADGVRITPRTTNAAAERFLVAHSGKPTDGIYSKFNRLLCRPAVRLLAHTPVTPNMVTTGGLIVAIVAALLFARGFYAAYVGGALLFFLSGLFDDADGMLARITFRESVFGTWFEGLVDETTYLLVFSGITAGLYRERGSGELIYGYLLIVGCVLSVAVTRLQRKMATAPDRPQEYVGRMYHLMESDSRNLVSRVARHLQVFIRKGVAIHYILIFTVLGGLPWLLRLAALGANLTWTVSLYFNWKFFRRPKTRAAITETPTAAETL